MNVERYYERAYLRLPEDMDEKEVQISKFERIIEMVDHMMEHETSEDEYFEITSEISSPLREDEIEESTDRELIFTNTKHREYGYFKLDNIMED